MSSRNYFGFGFLGLDFVFLVPFRIPLILNHQLFWSNFLFLYLKNHFSLLVCVIPAQCLYFYYFQNRVFVEDPE